MNIETICTTFENGEVTKLQNNYLFTEDVEGIEKGIINIYPQIKYQTIMGFGGALTESAGYVFSKMPEQVQNDILEAYYSDNGLRYSIGRTHIDSCDFSLNNYSAMADPRDMNMESFNLERDKQYIIPLIKKANKTASKPISIMLTPWSPPPFMKTNGEKNNGGFLKKEYYGLWAKYISHYINEYRLLGINVEMITVQNEPKAVQVWDSCVFTAEQEKVFLRDYLVPALKSYGLDHVEIFIWDHNKERAFDRACEIICDEEMNRIVAGIGLHWYSGDHFEASELIKRQFPNKRIVFTEACVEYSIFQNQGQFANASMYAHHIIGDLNGGVDTFIDWNIILDHKGGPNHVGNFCDAPILCNIDNGTWRKNLSYDFIGHFSRYIHPGAKRIGFSKFTKQLEVTAVENQNGEIAATVFNPTSNAIDYYLRLYDKICKLTAPAQSISTHLTGNRIA